MLMGVGVIGMFLSSRRNRSVAAVVSGFDWTYIVTCQVGRCAKRMHPERDADDPLLDHGAGAYGQQSPHRPL